MPLAEPQPLLPCSDRAISSRGSPPPVPGATGRPDAGEFQQAERKKIRIIEAIDERVGAMNTTAPIKRTNGNQLAGKAYLITGGSTGIGFATAELLVRDGSRVFLTGRNRQSLDAAQQQLGVNAIALQADSSDPEAPRELVRAIRAHVERLDGAFINAGGAVLASFEATTPQMFADMSNTNVRGAYFTVQALLPLLGEGSTIVFNSSIASRLGQPGTSAYSASKAALTSLGRTLAVDLAPRGIR